jgi:hydrogenase maturation protease
MKGSKESSAKKVLVAGVGNRLMGDDGFGPRVIDILSATPMPMNVEARDIGTAGVTIATDLSGYDLVVFLDAVDIEGEPGRLQKSEIVVEEDGGDMAELSRFTLHEVGLEGLLKFAKAIGVLPPRVILIGCKPKTLSPTLEISPEVEDALDAAAEITMSIVEDFLEE